MLMKLDKQKVKEEVNTVRFEGGKFCLDIAKLVIAGVIIAGVMKQDSDPIIIYSISVLLVTGLVVYGLRLINNSKLRR